MPFGKSLRGHYPSLTYQCDPRAEEVVGRYPPPAVVVDVGSGGRRLAPHVRTLDAASISGVDVVGDVARLPFPGDTVDLVVATGLIEHLADDRPFLAESYRVLKPGGAVYIEVPFLQQYHADPIDSRRYTVPGLERLLEQSGFRPGESGFHIGPSVTMATLAAHYAALVLEGRSALSRALSASAFLGVSLLGYPLKFADRFLRKRPSAHKLAFGVYALGEKRERAAGEG